MTGHDPLCPLSDQSPTVMGADCPRCDEYARVRADERERIAQEIEAMRCVQCRGHDDEPQVPALIWRDEAASIARGESDG